MKTNYYARKEQLKNDALKHHEITLEKYNKEIEYSYFNTKEYCRDFLLEKIEPRFDYTAIYFPVAGTSEAILGKVQELFDEQNESMCALNFSSYKNPGGQFLNGSSAQEECLCHESTLYEILRYFDGTFYKDNRKDLNNALYQNHLLYTPNVVFFNDEMEVKCDIITCAAPNATAAKKYRGLTDEEILSALINRIFFVLQAAYDQNVKNIILGAYGTGVFGNDVVTVSKIFKTMINHVFKNCFQRVIYAIPVLNEKDNTREIFMQSNVRNDAIEYKLEQEIKTIYTKLWKE